VEGRPRRDERSARPHLTWGVPHRDALHHPGRCCKPSILPGITPGHTRSAYAVSQCTRQTGYAHSYAWLLCWFLCYLQTDGGSDHYKNVAHTDAETREQLSCPRASDGVFFRWLYTGFSAFLHSGCAVNWSCSGSSTWRSTTLRRFHSAPVSSFQLGRIVVGWMRSSVVNR
jgi:hypothetical protein